MRIYELSKELNLSNKELLDFFKEKGVDFKSHMSLVSDDAQNQARSFFKKEKKSKPKPSTQEVAATTQGPKKMLQQSVAQKRSRSAKFQSKSVNKHVKTDPEPKPRGVFLREMLVGEFAQGAGMPSSEVILALLRQGVVRTKNQSLTAQEVERLAGQLGVEIFETKKEAQQIALDEKIKRASVRLPVVVVVGHVDHGKTTLLDYVRKTRVASREKGGITQHLGAYQAQTKHGGVVFLDTPGHEAFSNIRGRGIKVADIAVLMVAADDGIMPQTVEAIKTAQDANIPIIVAINKIDKADATAIDRIKQSLADHNLLTEEWGGSTIVMPISAKEGTGVNELLEALVLQAELMDLQADPAQPGFGFVLESRLEKGRGPVATILCQTGTLRIGDYFAAGRTYGRVSSMVDSFGKPVKEVGPSVPVRVGTFSALPLAGNYFEAVSFDKYKKIKNAPVERKKRIMQHAADGDTVDVLLKVDTVSTLEALEGSIKKLQKRVKKPINIVYSGVGDIAESDVVFATDTGAIVCGLHVKLEAKASALVQKNMINVHLYDVIYKLLEDLEEIASKEEAKMVLKKIGEAELRKVFAIKNIGVVAGSYVKDGRFTREGVVVGWRGKEKLGEGKIKSLQRDRKNVKEVHAGFEFAFLIDEVDSWEVGDRAECFIYVPE